MVIEVEARVIYTVELNEEKEMKVREYIKENSENFEFLSEKEKIIQAVTELWEDGAIELYDSYVESDFNTEDIRWSEFEEKQQKRF